MAQFSQITGNAVVLKVTCDDIMTLYVDGNPQSAANLEIYNVQSTIVMPNGYEVIAIKCVNMGGDKGLLASAENYRGELVLLSDRTWKCSSVFEPGWNQIDFETSSGNWQSATDLGEKSWSVSGQISPYASWIWTKEGGSTIYCRKEYPWNRGSYYLITFDWKCCNVFFQGTLYLAEASNDVDV